MAYETLYASKLDISDSNYQVLAAFHREKDAFNKDFKNAFALCGERVARIIEQQVLLKSRQSEVTFAMTGLALECLAHELRNDLYAQEGQAKLIQNLSEDESSDGQIKRDIGSWANKLHRTIQQSIKKTEVLRGARAPKEKVSVYECLYNAVVGARSHMTELLKCSGRFRIEDLPNEPKEKWYVNANPTALTLVFFNIYLNAIQQMQLMTRVRKYGRILHSMEHRNEGGKPWAVVRIHDTGPGIHFEDCERIYEPGFTTKVNGTGLGLWICRHFIDDIVEKGNRKATIRVSRSVIWEGTTFTVKLPLIT